MLHSNHLECIAFDSDLCSLTHAFILAVEKIKLLRRSQIQLQYIIRFNLQICNKLNLFVKHRKNAQFRNKLHPRQYKKRMRYGIDTHCKK